MINNNKILTVSYGTFSCTLEGFDDSFGTMKAIAEYFRDLSADDRYFGAEPAQPDAQMLARIAQREISRHVEARENDGHIVLSAQDTAQTVAFVSTDVEETAADPVVEIETAKAPESPNVEDDQPSAASPVEDIVAGAETPEMDVAAHHAMEDEVAPTVRETIVLPQMDATEVEEQDIVPSLPDADVEAFFADSAPTAENDETDVVEGVASNIEPAQDRVKSDSIADKLKRIRAVVSQQPDTDATPDYSEDQHAGASVVQIAEIPTSIADLDVEEADLLDDGSSDVIAQTLRDLEDALDADDAAESHDTLDVDLENEDDDITAILNRLEQEAASDDAPQTVTDQTDDDMDDNILAAMDSLVAAPQDDDLDDLADGSLFDGDEVEQIEKAPKPAATPAPRARVLKVKRATLEAAIKAGKLEEYDDDADEGSVVAEQPLRNDTAPRSSLTDQAEEELARDLAELEADMEADEASEQTPTYADTVSEEALLEQEIEDATEGVQADVHGTAEDDLSRLMAETDSQMGEPEGANRRDAFAHLRAAVAAKKADEAVGGTMVEEGTDEAYRDDLASVVRPRRPVSGARTRTERPAEQRPAPLKLVAEQRIDVAEARQAAPVRPRRVAAVVTAPVNTVTEATSSFADFAADVGAEKLPDILEAAAAYLSFIDGHEQFSRPQLMTKVREVVKENFTREDSLRSFGKLLREGKIEKLNGGRFQASDQIGFKPDTRAVG